LPTLYRVSINIYSFRATIAMWKSAILIWVMARPGPHTRALASPTYKRGRQVLPASWMLASLSLQGLYNRLLYISYVYTLLCMIVVDRKSIALAILQCYVQSLYTCRPIATLWLFSADSLNLCPCPAESPPQRRTPAGSLWQFRSPPRQLFRVAPGLRRGNYNSVPVSRVIM
jgi:hypothetical protein